MNVIPEQRKAVVSYPSAFKLRPKEINVFSKGDVRQKYESEVRQFIYSTLRSWVMERGKAFTYKKEFSGKRRSAHDKLLLVLVTHQHSRLHILCDRIISNGDSFIPLFPTKESRYYPFFKHVIAEILIWCEWYKDNHGEFNKNLFKN